MSRRVGRVAFLQYTHPAKCDFCGEVRELRPYGPKGENICYQCGQKDIATTERRMKEVLFDGADVVVPLFLLGGQD